MQLKAFDATGDFPSSGPYAGTASAAAALIYATDEGADLVNNSWGVFTGFDQPVADAVAYALDQDMRLICGAGNFGTTSFFPAELPGVIAVAAIDELGKRSDWGFGSSSCFGTWVDVCAGGTDVLAPWLDLVTVLFNGTSAATPNATGVAALALSEAPNLSSEDLRQVLQKSAVSVDALNPGFAGLLGAGQVNARGALNLLSHTTDLGGGLAGATAPALNAWGGVQPGAQITASLSRLPAGAPAGLAVGTSAALLPFFGGTLVPAPTVVLLGVADPTGRLAWSATLPGGLPAGAILFLQGGALDAGAPQGVSISNALAYAGG
jgi:subtilisin family serine protease